MIVIKNGYVFINNNFSKLDILIENQKVVKIDKNIDIKENYIVIDAKNTIVTPGFIDMHTHLREPGFSHKETISSGTQAAAKGGYTTIAAMPNTNPVPDSKENLKIMKELINKNAVVKVLPYSSITKNQERKEVVNFEDMIDEKVVAFSDDGKGIQNEFIMYEAMIKAKKHKKKIVAHCEDETLTNNSYIHEGKLSNKIGVKGITSESEFKQIERDLKLVEMTNVPYHVCHISTKESIELIKKAKAKGLNVSCEVTPHHLLLCEDDININNSNFKMNPPLRSKEDKEALINGLKEGVIDIIATDHAPHSENEKMQSFKDAPFGVVGLETCFPLLYSNLVLKDIISLEDLISIMTNKPARLFDLESGNLEINSPADITIIDLNNKKKIEKLVSKGKNSPFIGWECYGFPVITIVDGKIVYCDKKELVNNWKDI